MASLLESVQATLKAQIQELRNYAGELRPPSLSQFGLEKALRSHAEAFQEQHPDLQLRLETHFAGDLLPDPIRLALFRIYQQALANIVKHAQASQIHVQLIKNEQQVQLAVRDNGQGFALPKEWLELVHQGHLGLVGMRERAEAVGGRLEVHSQPGLGTKIQVIVPLQGQETA
jgi:signal transduction histidine kinase